MWNADVELGPRGRPWRERLRRRLHLRLSDTWVYGLSTLAIFTILWALWSLEAPKRYWAKEIFCPMPTVEEPGYTVCLDRGADELVQGKYVPR